MEAKKRPVLPGAKEESPLLQDTGDTFDAATGTGTYTGTGSSSAEDGAETESTYFLSEDEEGSDVRPIGSVTFDQMIAASVSTKDKELIESVRLLLLYGKVDEAKALLDDYEQRKEGMRKTQAVTFGVLGAVGGVAGALTFGMYIYIVVLFIRVRLGFC